MTNVSYHEQLYSFQMWYASYHGYVSLVVCVLGGICNLINIVVLTRPNMKSTTNYLLTGLAVSDLLTMLSYIPFALQFYCLHGLQPSVERNTEPWTLFFLFHVNFSVTTHTISIWLGVLLAIFRYEFVHKAASGGSICGLNMARISTAGVLAGSVVVLLPNYMSLEVVVYNDSQTNATLYDLQSVEDSTITTLNFWIHALVIKILPCGLMCVFGMLLICTMRTSNQRRQSLRRASMISVSRGGNARRRDHSRTTGMLVAVIVLFLLTELPQGILALCSGLLPGFFQAYYTPLGDVMDIIALINNGINFTLYCSMSRQFRETFLSLFMPCCLPPEKRMIRKKNKDYGIYAAARKFFQKEQITLNSTWTGI